MNTVIEIKNLSYSYPDGTAGLAGVTLSVREGEIVTIIGANGTGKSTLLLAFMGALKCSGEIKVFGEILNEKSLRKIRKRMNLVFQNPDDQLFSPTVMEDVVFGPTNLGRSPAEAAGLAIEALKKVGLQNYRNRLSHHLSFGEKKRTAIATILAMDPDILLLDEPTSGLDPRSAAELIDILYSLNKEGKTLVVATHDLHTADEFGSRVAVLGENKTIVACDYADKILSNRELLLANNLLHRHIHRHDGTEHVHEHTHFGHEKHHK